MNRIYKKILIGIAFLIVFIGVPISLQKNDFITAADAQVNPCGSSYVVSGPNAQGLYSCTPPGGGNPILVTASGQGVGSVTPTGTQTDASGTPLPSPACTSDAFTWSSFFSPSCWPSLVSGVISGALVYVTSSILTIAGVLFNWVLYETVLQFGQLINCGTTGVIDGCSNTGIITGINTAWSAFRDISNIVIIGMFTFIAIMTILGSVNYGAKKMISRVLIVAVLINFSLLFTKIIIDVSNFTAVQFYNAASANDSDLQDNNPSQAAQTNAASTAQPGIAGAFMKYAGVQGLGDTATAVFNISKNPEGGAWWGLLFGVVTALLYFVAAIVLFYGSFLLISRAILMIFLMITSSIAFASYLIPSLSDGSYGFRAWSQILLKNAVFAPLLMVLLWITLVLAKGFQNTSGTLGSAITSPANPLGISALFGYIVVIGLLFASFKIASSFSTSIGGFNFAQAALSSPFAAANRYLVAPGLRNLPWIGGRGQAARSQSLAHNINEEAKKQAALPKGERDFSNLTKLIRQKEAADRRAKSTFDVANTRVGQVVGKAAKVPGPLISKTKTNFADTAKHKADEAAKAATEVAVSKKDAEDVARKEFEDSKDIRLQDLKDRRATNQELVKRFSEVVEKTKKDEGLEDKLKDVVERARTEADSVSKDRIDTEERFRRGDIPEAERNRQLSEQADRINKANAAVQAVQNRVNVVEKPLKEAQGNLDEVNKAIDKHVADRTQEIMNASLDNAKGVGAKLTQNWLQRAMNLPTDTVIANKARKSVEKKIKIKGLADRREAEREELKDAGEDVGGEKKEEEHH